MHIAVILLTKHSVASSCLWDESVNSLHKKIMHFSKEELAHNEHFEV